MKKALVIGLVVVVLLVALVVFVPLYFMNSIVKQGVEAAGPRVAKVETRLESVNLSLFSGAGQLKGLFVGNPTGFQAPAAMTVGEVSVAVEPKSVFSDKVVVRSVKVVAPEITFEGGLQGNNLKKILENVQAYTGSSSPRTDAAKPPQADTSGGKKLQVDDLALTGGKVTLTTGLLGGQSMVVALPDIHMSGLGQGADGITGGELMERVMNEVLAKVTPLVADNLGKLGQQALDKAAGQLGNQAGKQLKDATKGLGDLLKKKK